MAPSAAGPVLIPPTVGRVVWFYLYDTAEGRHKGPFAATVAAVHSDRCVTLGVLDEFGHHFPRQSCCLVQAGDSIPKADYATWMPYQVGQAQKTEALQQQLNEKS